MGLDKKTFLSDNKEEPVFNNLDVKKIRKKETKIERQKTKENTLTNMSVITIVIHMS